MRHQFNHHQAHTVDHRNDNQALPDHRAKLRFVRDGSATLLDLPVGQGRRAQESAGTHHQHESATLPERSVGEGRIVGCPLTHARQVEQPTTNPKPPRRRDVIPWWSITLTTIALAVLGAAVAAGTPPLLVGAVVTVAMAGSCLVLVVAELMHRLSQIRPGR